MFNSLKTIVIIILIQNLLQITCNDTSFTDAEATTIFAASCSLKDVQSAIIFAKDGDIVVVPPGVSTWTSTLFMDPMLSITLQGAGIDKTVITDSTSSKWGQTLIWAIGLKDKPFRISGFTFNGTSDVRGSIYIGGNCQNWRIDNCRFTNLTYRAIFVDGHTYGLIDHCSFVGDFSSSIILQGDGDDSWIRHLKLGTNEAVYIEDCAFNYNDVSDGALDANGGARYVFRYNKIINTLVGCHGQDSGVDRSTFSYEVYNNTFTATKPMFRAMHFRGGTGVIFNNTIDFQYANAIHVASYRSCEGEGWNNPSLGRCDGSNKRDGNEPLESGKHIGPNNSETLSIVDKNWATDEWLHFYIWNITDGSKSEIIGNTSNTIITNLSGGIDNDFDTNDSIKITNGYPCQDQIGRSTNQSLEPLYEWNNTIGGLDADISVNNGWPSTCSNPSPNDHIKENRDFFNDTQRPGYVSFAYPHPFTQSPPENLRFIK